MPESESVLPSRAEKEPEYKPLSYDSQKGDKVTLNGVKYTVQWAPEPYNGRFEKPAEAAFTLQPRNRLFRSRLSVTISKDGKIIDSHEIATPNVAGT